MRWRTVRFTAHGELHTVRAKQLDGGARQAMRADFGPDIAKWCRERSGTIDTACIDNAMELWSAAAAIRWDHAMCADPESVARPAEDPERRAFYEYQRR